MARHLKVAAAQLGPIHKADDRQSVVRRLMDLLRAAQAGGAKLVVFPELALTTFFPRYWYDGISEIDAWFEREMPNAATRPLFDLAAELGVGFYLGYAELAEEGGVIIPFFIKNVAALRAGCSGYTPHMQSNNIGYETLTCEGKGVQ